VLVKAFSPVDRVQSQLQSIRSSHFVEDPEQIVSNSVLAQLQFMGNITIGHTFGYQVDDALFPFCKHSRSQ
jgi:hypothetical protein